MGIFISCSSTPELTYDGEQIWVYEDEMTDRYRESVTTKGDVREWVYRHDNLLYNWLFVFDVKKSNSNIYLRDKYKKVRRKPCIWMGIDLNKDGVIDVSYRDSDGDGGMDMVNYHGNDPDVIRDELQRGSDLRIQRKSKIDSL
jgi:hypothetical protein